MTRLAGALTILAAGLMLAAADAPTDTQAMQGTWTVESLHRNGEKVVPEGIENTRVTIEGNLYRVKRGDEEIENGTFNIDPTASPKTIDIIPMAGPDRGKRIPGIYKLEGDTLTACMARPGQERPKDFDAREGSDHMRFVYKKTGG